MTTQRRAVRLVKFRNIGIEKTKGIGCIYTLGYTDCMQWFYTMVAYSVYNAHNVYNAYNVNQWLHTMVPMVAYTAMV